MRSKVAEREGSAETDPSKELCTYVMGAFPTILTDFQFGVAGCNLCTAEILENE
jgi:hypothetical protein